MGRANNPLRSILNYASDNFMNHLPIIYILTVIGTDKKTGDNITQGLFIGNDLKCFTNSCKLSLEVNFTLLPEPLKLVVVYLDPKEFHSTWLGNKGK